MEKTFLLLCFVLFNLILLISSCEKETKWNLKSNNNDLIVVDGIITDKPGRQSIKLSFPISQLNEVSKVITGAKVKIIGGGLISNLTEQQSNLGVYTTDDSLFSAKIGNTYTLFVEYENKTISANTNIIACDGFTIEDYFNWSKDPSTNLYHFSKLPNLYSNKQPAMWEVLLDWSTLNCYKHSDPNKCKVKLFYYTLPTIDVNEVLAPNAESIYFPDSTNITITKYSLTHDYVEYLRALMSETNWQGGYFNSTSSNLPTNVSSGGIGYFSACSVYILNTKVLSK